MNSCFIKLCLAVYGLALVSEVTCSAEIAEYRNVSIIEAPQEEILHREKRNYGNSRDQFRKYKREPQYRFQYESVKVNINQQTRFLTKFGPYIIKLHLLFGMDMKKSYANNNDAMIRTAKQVVNYANTLLRPLNAYIMVGSLHIPAGYYTDPHVEAPANPDEILKYLQQKYVYYTYQKMFDEVVHCVFTFLGRSHMNFTLADSDGTPCDAYYHQPSCMGYVVLEHQRKGYIKMAGYALARELSARIVGIYKPHDDCECRFAQCLLSENVAPIDDQSAPVGWTTCDVKQVASALDSLALDKACLSAKWQNKRNDDGYSIIAEYSKDWGPTCGNGILEPGEQCDCGEPLACSSNPCCKGDVCQLAPGAECSSGDCCNTTTCKLMAEGVICRLAEDPRCDFTEFCTGTSVVCPPDVSVVDDYVCDSNTANRCRFRHCMEPRRNAKYGGHSCKGAGEVPTTNGECKARYQPLPSEVIEEYVDLEDDENFNLGDQGNSTSANQTTSPSGETGESPTFVMENGDQNAVQLRGLPGLLAFSYALSLVLVLG